MLIKASQQLIAHLNWKVVFQPAQRDGNYYVSLSFLLGYTKTIQNTKWNTYAYNPISQYSTIIMLVHSFMFPIG